MDYSFSKRIKELRTSLDLTQSQFAKEIGTTQATLSSYENTDKMPSIDTLIMIAQKYNVSLDWLCGLQNEQLPVQTIFTYSDLIRALSAMAMNDNLKINFSISSVTENFCDHPEAQISIDDNTLISFFSEWIDVLALCRKSPSGQKLYNIWIKDILERYQEPIVQNPAPRDQKLPFD